MPTAEGNVTVTAEMSADLCKSLDARRKQEGRSRSNAINAAVRFWLEYSEPMPADPVHKPKEKKR
jgi:metal-responsive CopG/Arc/MetJ family transcriptional regulator